MNEGLGEGRERKDLAIFIRVQLGQASLYWDRGGGYKNLISTVFNLHLFVTGAWTAWCIYSMLNS